MSCDFGFFWTSTSDTSSAGDEADTGTGPLSAPQMPLNVWVLLSLATILPNAESGVPIRSTPRTSSIGRPSAYTRYTTMGVTLNAFGM